MSDTTPPDVYDLQQVYEAEIVPLMSQVIAICQREHMPMVAGFCLSNDGDNHTVSSWGNKSGDRRPREFRLFLKMMTSEAFHAAMVEVAEGLEDLD